LRRDHGRFTIGTVAATRTLVRRGAPDGQDGLTEIDELVTAAERLAREHGARSTVFPYVDERDTALREVLARRGYGTGSTPTKHSRCRSVGQHAFQLIS
jgi:hypothetical protein